MSIELLRWNNVCKIFSVIILLILLECQHFIGVESSPAIKSSDTFDLIILHNNDMHARFEETGVYSDKCQPDDVLHGKCYGGFARVSYIIQKYRNETAKGGPPVLYLNAGDTFTGTPWFKIHEEKIVIDFLNALMPDAMSLGNHEFDLKIKGLISLLKGVHFPVVTANLDLTNEPEIANIPSLKNYTILTVNGTQIAIVGYLTPDTKYLANIGGVEILDEVTSINEYTKKLKEQGIKIIIALGHSGFEVDKKIARDCPDVDLVIGGHTNTFLYNGVQPSVEAIQGPYPFVVTQNNGKKVPVVSAYAYTKYMGYLELSFDKDGNLRTYTGQPIILDSTVPSDPNILKLLEIYRPDVEELQKHVIGKTTVLLDGNCRFTECNFGNLVSDAMVYGNSLLYMEKNQWTDASIAFMQSGGIRSSISRGNITLYDLATAFPFDNTYILKINLTGEEIIKALEHSVHRYSELDGQGEFLQMSGIHVVYNLSKPSGSRVKSVDVLCANCTVPIYEKLDKTKMYVVLLNSFLHGGGDGFDMFNKTEISLDISDFNIIVQYIQAMDIVYPAVEWRIQLEGKIDNGESGGASQTIISVLLICSTVFITLIRCDF